MLLNDWVIFRGLLGPTAAATLITCVASAQTWQNLISTTDASVPGIAGAVWVPNQFNNPTIDGAGRVTFRGQIGGAGITTANSRVIMQGGASGWTLIAREGSPVPTDNPVGYVFNTTTGINGLSGSNTINESGGILLSGNINGPGNSTTTDTAMYFVDSTGTATFLAREGHAYPGGGGSTVTTSLNLSSMKVNAAGEFVLPVALSGGDVSGTLNNAAIVQYSPSGATAIFRKGSPAPGFADGTTLTPDTYGINLVGSKLEFGGTLVGGAVTTADDKARFTNIGAAPGELRMYFREGAAVPGMTDVFYKPTTNASSAVSPFMGDGILFTADLSGPGVTAGLDDKAVVVENNGSVEVLFRRGEAVPGVTDGPTFFAMNNTAFIPNRTGMIAFQAILQNADGTGIPTTGTGVYVGVRKADGTKITICRKGDPVPGIANSAFGNLNGSTSICIGDNGVVVFSNTAVVNAVNTSVVMAWDETQGLRVIAKTGDTNFTGTPANQFTLIGSTGQSGDGGGTGMNASGVLVIRAADSVAAIHTIAKIDLAPPASSCPSDLNDDGSVDAIDLSAVLSGWGGPGAADINNDGAVNGLDLSEIFASWGPCS